MRYAVAFAGLAVASATLAALLPWGLAAPAAWLATSWSVVALAYGGLGPRLLGKTPDGELPWWSLAVNGPFLLLGLASMRAVHMVLREEPWTEVAPGIWLGRRPTRRDTARFRALGVRAILDLCAELPITRARTGAEVYKSLPVLDGQSPTAEQLADAIAWMDTERALGPLYVHCALGRSRSAVVVAAWRLAHGLDRSAEDCEQALRVLRPVVDLAEPQREALAVYRARLAR